jgi:hypothetical protein
MLLLTSQMSVVAAAPGARLEGMLLGVDGRPASDHRVLLVDGTGTDVGWSTTSDEGLYSFRGLPAGEYGLVVEGPEGQLGALAGPPLRLDDNELARRDLKLLEGDPASFGQAMNANYGLRARYAGMTTAEKTWLWVVVGVVTGLTMYLIFRDEDDASDFQMTTTR